MVREGLSMTTLCTKARKEAGRQTDWTRHLVWPLAAWEETQWEIPHIAVPLTESIQ